MKKPTVGLIKKSCYILDLEVFPYSDDEDYVHPGGEFSIRNFDLIGEDAGSIHPYLELLEKIVGKLDEVQDEFLRNNGKHDVLSRAMSKYFVNRGRGEVEVDPLEKGAFVRKLHELGLIETFRKVIRVSSGKEGAAAGFGFYDDSVSPAPYINTHFFDNWLEEQEYCELGSGVGTSGTCGIS